jgi:hypothetical protein
VHADAEEARIFRDELRNLGGTEANLVQELEPRLQREHKAGPSVGNRQKFQTRCTLIRWLHADRLINCDNIASLRSSAATACRGSKAWLQHV